MKCINKTSKLKSRGAAHRPRGEVGAAAPRRQPGLGGDVHERRLAHLPDLVGWVEGEARLLRRAEELAGLLVAEGIARRGVQRLLEQGRIAQNIYGVVVRWRRRALVL